MNTDTQTFCNELTVFGARCALRKDHKCHHKTIRGFEWSRRDDVISEPAPVPAHPLPQIFLDAAALISGPRRESYGPVQESFERVAIVWSALLKHEVTPSDVAKLMIAFKLCREAHAHKRDNLVDMAGYLALLDALTTVEL